MTGMGEEVWGVELTPSEVDPLCPSASSGVQAGEDVRTIPCPRQEQRKVPIVTTLGPKGPSFGASRPAFPVSDR